MSAYLLKDEDYQLIADWLFEHGNDTGSSLCYDIREFVGIDKYSETIRLISFEELKDYIRMRMRTLYNLNRIALVTRYGDVFDVKDNVQFIPKIPVHTIFDKQAIIKLQSLRYQCAEHIASDTKLFEKLDRFIGKMCEKLFSNA